MRRTWGSTDPVVLQTIQFYAGVLRQEGRKAEAAEIEARAAASSIARL